MILRQNKKISVRINYHLEISEKVKTMTLCSSIIIIVIFGLYTTTTVNSECCKATCVPQVGENFTCTMKSTHFLLYNVINIYHNVFPLKN